MVVQLFWTKALQWSPSITDTTRTKDFVLYSKGSFAEWVIVDHASLTIVASQSKTMDHEISWIDKRSIDIQPLDKNQGHIWAILQLQVADTYR